MITENRSAGFAHFTFRFRSAGAVLALGLLCLMPACQQQTPDTRAADENAVRQADEAWSKLAGAKDADGFVSYFAEDGIMLPANAPLAASKEAIRGVVQPMMSNPGFALSWKPTRVEVSRAGDLAYSTGAYELSLTDPKGQPMTDRGKYVTIWKKQADGTWKVAVDTYNSDLPAPVAH